jgi:putative endonuclease
VSGRPAERHLGNRAHGAFGEDQVARWYEARGYEVVARNWRSRSGELDLVVAKGDLLVFCEVKARTSSTFGSPFEAVTPAKQARLRRLASEWLAATGARRNDVRFDVAAVLSGKVEVLEAAF